MMEKTVISKDRIMIIMIRYDTYNHVQNNEKNDKVYRKVAFLMYSEIVNFRPQSRK